MKITFTDVKTLSDIPLLKELEKFGELTIFEQTSIDQRIERLKESDIVITNKVVIDREVIDNCKNLKLICVAATGTNNIDLKYANEKNIRVKNVKGYSTESVAQHTFALILGLMNQISWYDQYVKSGKYSSDSFFSNLDQTFYNLSGKTFGIVGMGTIGRRAAQIASAFGMKVIYFSASGNKYDYGYEQVDFYSLLQRSDVISIHSALNEHTRNLFSGEVFYKMKSDSLLINTGRGGIIMEKDLSDALNNKLIAGAALDVFEKEPISLENPLLHVKEKNRIILTPHIAWGSFESREILIKGIIENIKTFFDELS